VIGRWRNLAQGLALALLAAIPLASYYLHFTFVQGWYQSLGVGDFWFVSPLEGLESMLVTRQLHGPLLVGLLVPVVVAALLGRVFCSWVCPINTLQEFSDWLAKRLGGSRKARPDRWSLPRSLLWYVLVIELVLTLVLGVPLWVFLSPPGLVGRELMTLVFFHTLAWEGVIILAVLGLNFVNRRLYCRHLCPLGGLLGVLGLKRRLVVRHGPDSCIGGQKCDRVCPLGLAPSRGESLNAHCWNCGKCVDVCDHGGLEFRWLGPGDARPTSADHCPAGGLSTLRQDTT
jgi:ferredoxin-type protein NapH